MKIHDQFYINGQWERPLSKDFHEILNPATGKPCVRISMGAEEDIKRAISAAKCAFSSWSQTTAQTRADFINAAADVMQRRIEEFTDAITLTMGCPRDLCRDAQIQGPINAFRSYAERAFMMDVVEKKNKVLIYKDPIGVCAMINPWNYPLSQMIGKIGPALAAGCTMVVKPAEQTPLQDFLMAEVFAEVGLPAGVFNLVSGYGTQLGPVMSHHSDVDMVSFTGSTRAGIKVSKEAAATVKRVCLELGGKSPFIITDDADLHAAVRYGVEDVMFNTGQTCTALTRMLVPASRYTEAVAIAKAIAEENIVGNPLDPITTMGPMSTMEQRNTVLDYIRKGLEEGARLVTGGNDLPNELKHGAYIRPTIFADVTNNMTIAQEEIFGPVLVMISYNDLENAIEIANDTIYGLSSAVYAKDPTSAIKIARHIRAGQCYIQGNYFNTDAPFGGYKQSGNGREWGDEGLMEYVEIKSVIIA